MDSIKINNVKIEPGEKKRINIIIARLPSHTIIDMPVFIFRAHEPGPCLLLSAGIHGDEINGIEIIRQLIHEKAIMPEKGTVIAIPLVNVYGFLQSTRTLPDGKDLNRCFPGSEQGSLANQIAYIIMNEIIPHVDFGIDFHTGGSRITNYPQLRCYWESEEAQKVALAFAPPFIINSKFLNKSFRKEAYRAGTNILVYEGGESLRMDSFAIKEGKDGVKRLMTSLEMKNFPISTRTSILLRKTIWVRSKASGLLNDFVNYGDKVDKNQILAKIHDPYGQNHLNVKSPQEGYIIGLNNMPVIHKGDAMLHLGIV